MVVVVCFDMFRRVALVRVGSRWFAYVCVNLPSAPAACLTGTAPEAGSVQLFHDSRPSESQASLEQLEAMTLEWTSFDDPEVEAVDSAAVTYVVSVGHSDAQTQFAKVRKDSTGADSYSLNLSDLLADVPEPLRRGTMVFTVAARNPAGLTTAVATSVVVDRLPPMLGSVEFPSASAVRAASSTINDDGDQLPSLPSRYVQTSSTTLNVSWTAFAEHDGAPLGNCTVEVLSLDGGSKLSDPIIVDCSADGELSVDGLDLPTGLPGVVAVVYAEDSVGFVSSSVADPPLIVDATAPVVTGLVDGLARGRGDVNCVPRIGSPASEVDAWLGVADGVVQVFAPTLPVVVSDDGTVTTPDDSTMTRIGVQWESVSDPESGVDQLQVSVVTDPEHDVALLPWATVAAGTTAVEVLMPRLNVGEQVHVGVRASNGAGMWSDVRWSNGMLLTCGADDPAVQCVGSSTMFVCV